MKKLAHKIWILMFLFMLILIAFMYVFSDFIYEELYVRDTEKSMFEVGQKLQTMYQGGKVSADLIARIEEYNAYSNFNVFAVRNPRELSACLPFDIDYQALIGLEEREKLLQGKVITKIGYEERFDRQIISVIFPFTDENRLEGIIYLYYPLTKISELPNNEVMLFIGGAILFSLLLGIFVYQGLRKIMQPLQELQGAAIKMSEGAYETRVQVASKDEIGQLATAFNDMAQAVQQEDEEQKVFLATVSHELRTPISYVKGYSEAIQQQYMSSKEQYEAIQLIAREANRMERMTNDLMQLARSPNELEPFELYPNVLSELIRDAMTLLKNQAVKKTIQFDMQFDEGIIALCDEEKMKQIIINLLENAIRYSNDNSTIQIMTKEHGNFAIITMRDRGIGIPKEDLPRIKERFYRVNKARSRIDGGSGLGLSIVEQLVAQHGGQLTIESEWEQGTTVTVTIPIVEE